MTLAGVKHRAIATEADNLDELDDQVREAVRCHFDVGAPHVIRLHFVRDRVLMA